MGFKSVFRALQEVFPQVDVRILKAAAIEHSKDADAAVEFILTEVLPSVSIPVGVSYVSPDKQDYEQLSDCNALGVSHASGYNHDFEPSSVGRDLLLQIEEQTPLLGHQEAVDEANKGSLKPSSVASEDYENAKSTANISSTCLDETVAGSSIFYLCGGNGPDQQLIPLDKNEELNIIIGSHQGPHAASSSKIHDDVVMTGNCSDAPRVIIQDLNKPIDHELDSSICGQSSFDANPSEMKNISTKVLPDSAPVLEELQDLEEDEYKNATSSSVSEYDNLESRCSLENVTEQVIFEAELADPVDNSSSTAIVTGSGQICRIDLLEDSINEAKNNKKTLFSFMELVINTMREVELQEKAAEEAKQEAARGGLEILAKAEGIRQMLQRAKEANDMHAGEVYGEKAILATEARELQSRLLNLSDERDKSLAILDEMCQTLEARLEGAEEIRKVAEQEKLEKEESAQKYLAEQEDLMDKVVQESKRLQLEAEENSKLREFLMDRGHVVDVLQGEIAVICKDIKLLKEKFDDRIPLSKSLCSSQTSCRLASSGSSSKILSEQGGEPSETANGTGPAPSTDDQSQTSNLEVKGIRAGIRRMVFDDDWDLFEDEMVLFDA